MSEIDDTEKSLRDFAALRRQSAGTAPLRMPGPMRERLRVEINAMSDCDSVFERKSGFGIGALLRILIPTAAVAAVTVVSFRAWDFDSSTPSGAAAAASLHKEEDKVAQAKPVEDSSKFESPSRQRNIAAAQPAVPVIAAATGASTSTASERPIASLATPALLEEAEGFAVAMNRSQASGELSLEALSQLGPAVVTAPAPPLAEPTAPGYGEPREATLAPTIPVETAKQLSEPVATLRFRSNAPGAILSRFVLRRVGDVIELTDSDGSRYTAEITMEKLKRAAKADLASREAVVEHFTVSGVNQTIGKKVTITGSLFEAPISLSDKSSNRSLQGSRPRIHAIIQVEGHRESIPVEGDLDN